MKRSLLFIIAAFLFSPLFAQYEVTGGSGKPLLAHKNGITEIYLLNGLEEAQINFTSSQSGEHQWYRYRESMADAVLIPCSQDKNTSVITDIQEGYGYYVATPMGTGYIWIVDYSRYISRLSGLRVMEDEYMCEQLKLVVNADIPPVYYYMASGQRNTLQRDFLLTYNTLEWQEEIKEFGPKEVSLELSENRLFPEIMIADLLPLVNTAFTLTDVFAEHFGIAAAVTSEEYRAIKVEAHAYYERDREFGDNEKHSADSLSAPIGYTFTAYANEPVAAYYIWKVLKYDRNTNQYNTIVRYTEPILRYTFENEGNYVVELEVDDAQSLCADTSQTFPVLIGKTDILIPNVFTPGSSPGINDELKVSFSSVISFQASVFNRWGNLLYRWTDPTKGWNGMVNGKLVPTGAYLLVVEYTDSEGKRRNKSQMVNLLRRKNAAN